MIPEVKQIYMDLIKQGIAPRDAAKAAQARTGMSVITGKPINRQLKFTKGATYSGQYRIAK